MDRLDAMQVLLAVVDEGSLSAGSRKLNAPLPSVSRKVAELERHLGTRLLIRTSRNVQLTDAGRDYVEAARQIVAQVKDAELRASGEYEVPRGELKITATMELGRSIVLPLAYDFLREHSEITLNTFAANRFVDLTEEHVDVGVRIGQLSDSALVAVKVGTFRAVTCASPDYLERKGHPNAPTDLADHDAVVFGNLSFHWTGEDWGLAFPGAGVLREAQPVTRVYANDVTAACAAAVQGFGISRLPNYSIAGELRSGALVEILEDYAPKPIPVHLVYMKQGLLPLKVRAFIDWMTPRLRKALKECDGC
jgi:DNA-binding transcriptional LysR family regulator